MIDTTLSTPQRISGYGRNLVLRRSTAADAEKLAEFNGRIHGDNEDDARRVGEWTRDLLRGNHPTFGEGDFTIVEDTRSGKIVSSLNLISQTWSYAGIPFKAGRPELVGTDPEYRGRGLVRLQFEVIHQWSKQRGELVQGITGIPYYYRLFGYEMTVDLEGGYAGYSMQLPALKEDESEPVRFRPAAEGDISFVRELCNRNAAGLLLRGEWSETDYRYVISGMSAENVNRTQWMIIESPQGERLGYLGHPPFLWWGGERIAATMYELVPSASWVEITPAVIRYLWATGERLAAAMNTQLKSYGLWLYRDHPAYQAVPHLLPHQHKPYCWYLRVPDLPAFLGQITPVLERRLENSVFAGYSGELKFSCYSQGLRVVFTQGKLDTVENWQPAPKDEGNFAFPDLTFLHLLFGHRTQEEIQYIYRDCWAEERLRALLGILFPKQVSCIFPIN